MGKVLSLSDYAVAGRAKKGAFGIINAHFIAIDAKFTDRPEFMGTGAMKNRRAGDDAHTQHTRLVLWAPKEREENIERELDGEKDITCRSERVDM
jgi:hypothetical protein